MRYLPAFCSSLERKLLRSYFFTVIVRTHGCVCGGGEVSSSSPHTLTITCTLHRYSQNQTTPTPTSHPATAGRLMLPPEMNIYTRSVSTVYRNTIAPFRSCTKETSVSPINLVLSQ